MKKIFTLFAAMLLVLTASAKTWNITPDKADTLRVTVNAAAAGDTIVMAAGTYTMNDQLIFRKNLYIKAAADSVVVKQKYWSELSHGAKLYVEGIYFDGSSCDNRCFRVYDATPGNELHFYNCHFYRFPKDVIAIDDGSKMLDSLIIDNCFFHDFVYSAIHIATGTVEGKQPCYGVKVTNSTFANINAAKEYRSVIQVCSYNYAETSEIEVLVDHCTFYNYATINTDYGAVTTRSITNSTISNCIMLHPATVYDRYATACYKGVVKNCLSWNLNHDGKSHRSGPTRTDTIYADPLFADTANCDFTLAVNSPAKEAGVGGTPLGDPRWWNPAWAPVVIVDVNSIELNKESISLELDDVQLLTATVLPDNATDPTVTWTSSDKSVATVTETGLVEAVTTGTTNIIAKAGEKYDTCVVTITAASVPSTNFSESLILSGKKAHLAGAIWKNEAYKLYGDGEHNKQYGTASWTIHVTQPCVVTGTLNGVEGGHIFALDLYQGSDSLCSLEQPSGAEWWSGLIDMNGKLTFPAAGDYTLKLRNTQAWSSGKVAGITLTKEYDLIDIYLKAGVWHDAGAKFGVYDRGSSSWWPEFMENVEGDLYVFRNFPANKVSLNFVRLKNTTVAPGNDDDIWNQVVEKTRTNDNNYFKISDWSAGDWRKYFPGFDAGYYLVGTHNSWEPKAADILAENVEGVEYMITKNAEEGDQFKAIRIDTEGLNAGWYPDGSDNEYTIPEELAGNVTIYFKPAGDDSWPDTNGGGKKFYVQRNGDPTAIDNTLVGEKAVKLMENGQLVIIKNGVCYNVLGTVIK